MSLEQDITVIAALSKDRWNDNWNFREFLMQHVEPGLIDATARRLNAEVSAQIDCTTCGNCCRESKPSLSGDEIALMARAKGLSAEAFRDRHTAVEENGMRSFSKTPCPMLNGKICNVYESRPFDCASYPHLKEPDFLGGSVGTIENYRVCPIVFNVYEQMKVVLGYDPGTDYIGEKMIDE